MKTLPILILAALTVTATAQRKLWTWESPLKDDPEYYGNLNAAAADSKGYSALVIGETAGGGDPSPICQQRFLWVSPKGAVLHEEVIERPNEYFWLAMDSLDRCKVLHVSAKAVAVTDGQNIWTVSVRGKKRQRTVTENSHLTGAFPTGNPVSFAGWFQQEGSGHKAMITGFGEIYYQTPKTISLWSIK